MLSLGIIGMSTGNGHPYSWSAIHNGYDPITMETCGFPAFPRHLEKRRFPDDQIKGARVTHVWTQEPGLAQHIAAAARIETVVSRYEDMIGQVDGVLLARDDADRHVEFAMPFLDAGMPIYIDKPLALNCADARKLFSAQKYSGQLFTCSALRYANELQLSCCDRLKVGEIRRIHAITPKDWDKYAVHVIEPALMLVGDGTKCVRADLSQDDGATTLVASLSEGRQLLVSALGDVVSPMTLRIIGDKGWRDLIFRDTFSAFRSALQAFVETVMTRRPVIAENFVMDVIALLEAGRTP